MEKQFRRKTQQSPLKGIRLNRLIVGSALIAFLVSGMLSGCADDLMNPIPTIEINPGFAKAGFSNVTLVSQDESTVHSVVYSRVYGISRDLTMTLTVDESVLTAYNAENGTSYKVLPSEFYSMPASVTFAVKEKNADFDVQIKTRQLYQSAGSVQAASQYVLPIKAVTDQKHVDTSEESNVALIHINMLPATISTSIPAAPVDIYFVEESSAIETKTIGASLNFTGTVPDVISVVADPSASLLSQAGYKLLPSANYKFGTITQNGKQLSADIQFNAAGLTDAYTYLLPCRLQSSHGDYVISQQEPVYFAVNITGVEITVVGADPGKYVEAYANLKPLNGAVTVSANSMLPEALTINMVYDPSLIDAFNKKTGKDFLTLPSNLNPKITNGRIAAGAKEVDIRYEIDVTGLAFGDHYLVPLVLQTKDMEHGEVIGSEVIYLDVARSLAGEYNREIIRNDRTRNITNTIWEADKCQRKGDASWDAAIEKAQFGFGGDGDWYAVLFAVTDKDMPGKSNCKRIEIYTFLELLEETGGSNKVTNNESYYNTVTGEIYIDCSLYESWFDATYKETYSFKVK